MKEFQASAMYANYQKRRFSRHAFTDILDAQGNAGMHNYQSELLTSQGT